MMGNFDIIDYMVKCPQCGKNRKWIIQTRSFIDDERHFDEYPFYFDENAEVNCSEEFIDGIGNCPICRIQKHITIRLELHRISRVYELH